jgi:peptidoglycan/xylan/chitin deacetylase (PgdA/CDA1 family)
MNSTDVRRLAGLPGLSIGAHGEHHLALPCQPLAAQRKEVVGSKSTLEVLLGGAVDAFAYPFGFWDEGVVEVVRSAGFALAVTTQPGTVSDASDALRLPRLEVRECSVADLDRQMRVALDAPAA